MPFFSRLIVPNGPSIPESELAERFVLAQGPGGQNVNKVSSAVQLRFDVNSSRALNDRTRRRLLEIAGRLATRDGVIVIEASRFRSQEQNRIDARRRLAAMISEACKPPPAPRRKTRPKRSSIEKRLKAKARRSMVKKLRGPITGE